MNAATNLSGLGLAAVAYAKAGLNVFPLGVRGKKPLIPKKDGGNGCHDGATDEAKIRKWWTDCPNANIGIATGRELPGGGYLAILDVDPRNRGEESLRALTDEHGDLPGAPLVYSGRGDGGRHRYLRTEKPLRVASKQLPDGIDIKAVGGYVVAPPSIHPDSGEPYYLDALGDDPAIDVASIPFMPAWLVDLAARKETGDVPPQEGCPDGTEQLDGFDGRVRRCRAYLEKIRESVSGKRGHDRCFQAACECFRFGLSDAQAREMLDWFNGAKCRPPWSRAELDHKLDDARKEVSDAGEFGSRLKEAWKPPPRGTGTRPPGDFVAAGIALVVEEAHKAKTGVRWSAVVRVIHAATGESLGSLPVSVTPSGLRDGERDLRDLLKRSGRVLGSRDEADLVRAFRRALEPVHLKSVEREQEERDRKPTPAGKTMVELAGEYLRETLGPSFIGTRGAVWSEKLRHSITPRDLENVGGTEAVDALSKAADFLPPTEKSPLRSYKLSRDALKEAWKDIIKTLPDEVHADSLGPDSAAARALRNKIIELWFACETWVRHESEEGTTVERTSFAGRVRHLRGIEYFREHAGLWHPVLKAVNCYFCDLSGKRVYLGMRYTALRQLAKVTIEGPANQRDFAHLLRRYGLAAARDEVKATVGHDNERVVPLSLELSSHILFGADPVDPDDPPSADPATGEILDGTPPVQAKGQEVADEAPPAAPGKRDRGPHREEF